MMSKKQMSVINCRYYDTLNSTEDACDIVNDTYLDAAPSRCDPASANMEIIAEPITRRNNNTLGPYATEIWQTFEHDEPWRGAEEWRFLSTSLLRIQ
jgi:hypothetical protein